MASSNRLILVHIAIGMALMCAGLLGLDRSVAEHLRAAGCEGLGLLLRSTDFLDMITGKTLSKFLPGLLLAGGAVAFLVARRTRALGRKILFVGTVQLSATLLTGVSKNLFGRLRPFELLESGAWDREWFVGGSAFPSGHAGFYFGLFLPLAYLFPRLRWPLLAIPWFIAVARIDANHHFIADVAASIAIAGVLVLLLARLVERSDQPHAVRIVAVQA